MKFTTAKIIWQIVKQSVAIKITWNIEPIKSIIGVKDSVLR